jgi:hypothetical protein
MEDFGERSTDGGIGLEEVATFQTKPDGVLNVTALDLGVESGHALIVEWNFSADEHVKHNSETPYIWTCIHARGQQLRRDEIERTIKREKMRNGVVEVVGETKVDDLDVSGLGN